MRSFVIWSISSILSRHSFITTLSKTKNLCIIVIIKHILLSLIRHNWAGNNTEVIKPSDVYSAQGYRFFLWFPESLGRTGKICILLTNSFIYHFDPSLLQFSPVQEVNAPAVGRKAAVSRNLFQRHFQYMAKVTMTMCRVHKLCPCFRSVLFIMSNLPGWR